MEMLANRSAGPRLALRTMTRRTCTKAEKGEGRGGKGEGSKLEHDENWRNLPKSSQRIRLFAVGKSDGKILFFFFLQEESGGGVTRNFSFSFFQGRWRKVGVEGWGGTQKPSFPFFLSLSSFFFFLFLLIGTVRNSWKINFLLF